MNEVLRGLIGRRVKRLRDVFESVPLRNGRLNRLLSKEGSQTVRTVLSEPVNGRQEVFVLPGGEAIEGQVDLDSLPVAMLRLDSEGRVVFANHLAQDLLPACSNTQEPRLAAMVEGLGRSVREWVGEAAAGRGLYRPETVRMTGAETETYLQITLGRPLQDGEGGLLAVLNDATELKTLEAQFVQSQKMQAIGQLAGGVAHDFNNLLTAISGHCDLMLLRHAEGDEDYADLMQVTQNANRAAALVGQLLAFSRKQTLEMQPINLRETLGDLAHLLNRLVGERVTLRLEHDPALLPIRGDRRQLEQVLMNLVVNARDAMPDGGEIRIQTECRFLEQPLLRDRVNVPVGQYVVLQVSDQGSGISPDNLARIFEPFFTTKRPGEGTGLGLSMAYGIIKQSGGYIFADSRIGQGTVFSLFFPAMSGEQPQVAGAAAEVEVEQVEHILANPEADIPAEQIIEVDAEEFAYEEDCDVAELEAYEIEGSPVDEDAGQVADEHSLETLLNGVLNKAWNDADPDPAEPAQEEILLSAEAEGVSGTEDLAVTEIVSPPVVTASADIAPTPPVQSAPDTAFGPDPSRPVVLLVEDEAPVRAFASRALRLRGYNVLEADCAEAALDRLADQELAVDLFVTDVMMPGLDGPSWVREAMKARPDVRTVFMSGYTQDALSETSVPIPNAMFLAKPFSLADLTRTVERALS
ncbi:ATP-binding protein [Jannaschia pohangensis]|nr:ATP-binding protein [Jannaschia pohangensis]